MPINLATKCRFIRLSCQLKGILKDLEPCLLTKDAQTSAKMILQIMVNQNVNVEIAANLTLPQFSQKNRPTPRRKTKGKRAK
ncbi:MAG: hypothetical protein EWV50_05050 [Microcystis aeruginosa Ma_MB_F_20061100_S20]|uniref:Uncharacterized protein n=1 Tax=Microcystis aeruginosa Ma_MB_F_20061100_S20D TaxID=2486253 RepID=A0A552EES8_MICAE|nr:MAG: hypothetical protein EWV78_17290 [Microcystis aeruginosa Ma_MB_F_20061100_S20D]TRU41889.1 MAG: hypothetical protein EWV50_05050 [Microcystis aeruginosa Ma_MB_F_20061100_S20]